MKITSEEWPLGSMAWVRAHVLDEAVRPLRPGDEDATVIVRWTPSGKRTRVVDGYHRLSGMLAWADQEGMDYWDIMVRVLVVAPETPQDKQILADAGDASAPEAQEEALDAIYEVAHDLGLMEAG